MPEVTRGWGGGGLIKKYNGYSLVLMKLGVVILYLIHLQIYNHFQNVNVWNQTRDHVCNDQIGLFWPLGWPSYITFQTNPPICRILNSWLLKICWLSVKSVYGQ